MNTMKLAPAERFGSVARFAPEPNATDPTQASWRQQLRRTRRLKTKREERQRRSLQTTWFVVVLDFFAVLAAWPIGIAIAGLISRISDVGPLDATVTSEPWARIFTAVVTVIALWLNSAYTWHVRVDAQRGLRLLVRSVAYANLVLLPSFWFAKHDSLLDASVYVIPSVLVCLIISRQLSSWVVRNVRSRQPSRILMAGTSDDIAHILGKDIAARFPLHKVTAVLLTDPENSERLREQQNLRIIPFSETKDISTAAADHSCESVWVASVGHFKDKDLRRLAWSLSDLRIRLYLEPMLGGIEGTRVSHERVGTRTVMEVKRPRFRGANGILKRVVDLTVSAAILICISPILAVTAIAIKIEDGGPVFYKSIRVGRYGEPFQMWKFRSMHVNADKMRDELARKQGKDTFLFKMKDDPRVTKVGKFIRKTSIDELPQFINSLLGSMSIVGPRPPLESEAAQYNSDMRMRLQVKPGITGLWQVNGRSDLSPEQAENLDLYYVDNWSIGLDVIIFFRTFWTVAASRGAY